MKVQALWGEESKCQGKEVAIIAGRKYWTRQMIIDRLQRCETPPTAAQFRKATDDSPCFLTVQREFGSWEAALKAAGWVGFGSRGRRPNSTRPLSGTRT
jgi:hypothetical protein